MVAILFQCQCVHTPSVQQIDDLCKAAVTPSLTHWSYSSLALSHQYDSWSAGLGTVTAAGKMKTAINKIKLDRNKIRQWLQIFTSFHDTYTAWCCYNPVNFLKNPHKRHPIARLWGQAMGCLLWVLLSSVSVAVMLYMWYHVLLDWIIAVLGCIYIWFGTGHLFQMSHLSYHHKLFQKHYMESITHL